MSRTENRVFLLRRYAFLGFKLGASNKIRCFLGMTGRYQNGAVIGLQYL
jgi:hypothetical protein